MADLDATLEQAVKKQGIPSRTVDQLEERGAKLRNKDELLEWAVRKFGLPCRAANWLEERGAKLRNKDELLAWAVKKYGLPSRAADWLEERGAKLRNKDELLEWVVKEYGLPTPDADWLVERGAKLRNKDELLEWAVKEYGLPNRTVGQLEERGAKLRNKDELLEWAVKKYGIPSRAADCLVERGAKMKDMNKMLEDLCLLCEPTHRMIQWVMGLVTQESDSSLTNLRRLFGSQARKVDWLLRQGARIHSVTIRFLLWFKRYGDGVELKMLAQGCAREDFEYVLTSRGARLTPRVVFELLSVPVVSIRGCDGTVMHAPEALLRLRSTWFEAALRWRVKERPVDMLDVEADDLKFIVHFITSHPDDVNWGLLQSSLVDMADLADEYGIIDLHNEVQQQEDVHA